MILLRRFDLRLRKSSLGRLELRLEGLAFLGQGVYFPVAPVEQDLCSLQFRSEVVANGPALFGLCYAP